MSGTWTKAAVECACHTLGCVTLGGDWDRARQTGGHWWIPLPRPCCCLGTAEPRGTIPMHGVSQLGSGSTCTPSPEQRPFTLPGSTGIVSLAWAGCLSLGAEELLRFGSCQSQVLLPPLYPCWAHGLGTAVCPLHVLLSCPSLWAGAWVGLCSRTGMSCSSPTSHCCPWKQGGGFSVRISGSHQENCGCKDSSYC